MLEMDSLHDNMNMPYNGFGSGVNSNVSNNKKGFDQTKAPRMKADTQIMAGFESTIFSPHPPSRNE
jgi:hypothetical protein